ncbi:unnamed protein product [Blepharisma stoltei]|uniref:Protein arginine methyltransferase NDUFAF7 n=1 Tax=Blepharisma stoltei TaxID=1481888 RepID=A0AAU9J461_9CILI|nr:unnamed protein product [Blepharisma stoltei]
MLLRRFFRGPRGTIIKSLQPKKDELKEHLTKQIISNGPLSFAQYMEQCLAHPQYGYYCQGDVFGRKGDFITSPEISQLFGEMIGVWLNHVQQKFKNPFRWNLIELGPGRGTLTCDILRTLKSLDCLSGLSIHLVDVSAALRKIQKENIEKVFKDWGLKTWSQSEDGIDKLFYEHTSFLWYDSFEKMRDLYNKALKGYPAIVIGHELFDALPIYIFEFSEQQGWCEVQVNLTENDDFQLIRSNGPNQNVKNILKPEKRFSGEASIQLFEGNRIELSPVSVSLMTQICDFINSTVGAGIIIDYGENHSFSNSIRGIKGHEKLDADKWLQMPGKVDLSAYVDFSTLKAVADTYTDLRTIGPIPQGFFLESMGIGARVDYLKTQNNAEKGAQLDIEYERLASSEQMGEIYKVLYTGSKSLGEVYPFLDNLQIEKNE